ncbi:MAG: choice-of-anchor tandem repeat GloVer-containing protein, partial [Methylosarcina sp.]
MNRAARSGRIHDTSIDKILFIVESIFQKQFQLQSQEIEQTMEPRLLATSSAVGSWRPGLAFFLYLTIIGETQMKSYWTNSTILYLLLAWLAVPWVFPVKEAAASAEFQVLKVLGKEGGNPYAGLTLDGAGNLYGTALAGGDGTEGNAGTVFKIDPSGNVSVLFNFSANGIGRPSASVVPGGDGSLYGTTPQFTGDYTATAYKIDASGNFILLHAFVGDFGGFITTVGGLIKGIDGNFYGASSDCVPENRSGTIYKIDSAGNYSVVYEFPGQLCFGGPNSEPIQGSDGSFYGTTSAGGTEANGATVFKLDPSGNFSILHEFDSGFFEQSKLLLTSDGSLYGATFTGGANDAGILYKIDPSGTFSVLHEFDGGNGGKAPAAGLIQGSDGNFYGTTTAGGTEGQGIVYRISPSGDFSVLHSFDTITGANPYAPLVQYGDGSFYGTTVNGGSFGEGVVFRIDPTGTVSVVYSFGSSDEAGTVPLAELIQGKDGNFYGTNSEGGDNGSGTVYRIDSAGYTEILHSFDGSEGSSPHARLLQDPAGNFYGTTYYGGSYNAGTIFKLDASGMFSILHDFDGGSGGANPEAGLIRDSRGNLYGTTHGGGANSAGTVYKLTPAGAFSVLHQFDGAAGGKNPYAGLLRSSDGTFYGTTYSGGNYGQGTVFKLTAFRKFSILHHFEGGTGGSSPDAELIRGRDGKFYGTVTQGGDDALGGRRKGAVFQIDSTGSFSIFYQFNGSDDGGNPHGVSQGRNGNFYGTSSSGGVNGYGTIYRLDGSGNFSALHQFDLDDGGGSVAALLQADDGSFYGTTSGSTYNGGVIYNGGAIFRLTETTQATTT